MSYFWDVIGNFFLDPILVFQTVFHNDMLVLYGILFLISTDLTKKYFVIKINIFEKLVEMFRI